MSSYKTYYDYTGNYGYYDEYYFFSPTLLTIFSGLI